MGLEQFLLTMATFIGLVYFFVSLHRKEKKKKRKIVSFLVSYEFKN